jgi:hypothetical protein
MPWPLVPVATNDIITAAQLNQLPIALAKLSGSAASIDFTGIPAYWTHLLLVASVQGNSGAQTDTLACQFNGDTTAHYQWERHRGSGTSESADGYSGQTFIGLGEVPGGSGGNFSTHFIIIPNYALVATHDAVAFGHTSWTTGTAANQNVWVFGGVWYPTTVAAINRVTLFPGTGSFVTGSIGMLYGMGYF